MGNLEKDLGITKEQAVEKLLQLADANKTYTLADLSEALKFNHIKPWLSEIKVTEIFQSAVTKRSRTVLDDAETVQARNAIVDAAPKGIKNAISSQELFEAVSDLDLPFTISRDRFRKELARLVKARGSKIKMQGTKNKARYYGAK